MAEILFEALTVKCMPNNRLRLENSILRERGNVTLF